MENNGKQVNRQRDTYLARNLLICCYTPLLKAKRNCKMIRNTKYEVMLLIGLIIYFIPSMWIFNKVNQTIHIVIDEYFHIPQGIAYCKGMFSTWDPKITTLPGLYTISSIIGLLFKCDTYKLRFVNLIASCINYLIFSNTINYIYFNEKNKAKIIIQALSLTILPPLYFFSHVYYTDTLSLTFILAFSRLCCTNKHKFLILLCGLCSILMRQTNVVWVAMIFGHKFLDRFIRSSRVLGNQCLSGLKLSKDSPLAEKTDLSRLKNYYELVDVYYALRYHLSTYFKTFFRFLTLQDAAIFSILFTILGMFSCFVYLNGSIVVGDKHSHEATIHIPQLLYFLIFYGVFGFPFVLSKLFSTLELIFRSKLLAVVLGLFIAVVVHYNTQVHPYLLADNRHYTFYIWNRWYGKYDFAIYASIPVYIFLLFSIYDNLRHQNCISFLLPYTVGLTLACGLQKLIEIRYFLIPFIILRVRFERPTGLLVICEFLWYILINYGAFYVFFNKVIYWQDFDYAQRIIW